MSSGRRLGAIMAHELRLARRDPFSLMVLLVFPIITTAFLKPAFRPRSSRAATPTRTAPSTSCPAKR